MAGIFLSYAREDSIVAEKLATSLESAGHEVWWDRRLDGGEDFAAGIETALAQADAVVVAWSKRSVKSRWVRDEAAVGGDTERLIPVSIDGSLPPMGFRQFHTLDLSGWTGGEEDVRTGDLLHAIERRLKRPKEIPREARPVTVTRSRPDNRWLRIAAGVGVAVLAAFAVYFLVVRDRTSGGPAKPTIVLLPLTTSSSGSEVRDLAAQTRDALSHSLSQSGLPVRLLDARPQNVRDAGDFLISGEVSSNGDRLVATVRLEEARHGLAVFSRRFEANREEARDLPERIGAQMAGTFAWAAPLIVLERRHPSDAAVTADLFNQLDFTASFDTLRAYQATQRAVARAPNSPFALVSLAFNTAFVLEEIPRDERPQAVATARRAARRTQEIAPEFGDSYALWCYLRSEVWRAECEDRLRSARRIDTDAPFLNTFLANLLRSVGRLEEAVEVTRLSYSRDPYVPTKLAWMLRMVEFAGEHEEAAALHRQGARWWPEFADTFFWQRLSGRMNRGDFDAIRALEEELGPARLPDGYPASEGLIAALAANSAASARQACAVAEDFSLDIRCMLVLARLGDADGAFAIADRLYPRRVGRTAAETERIWLDDPAGGAPLEFVASPAAAPLRRDPRYLHLAARVGLLAYWRSGRAPDFCRKEPEPVCAQLLKRN